MSITITNLFERVGAPLRNPRWSWGAVRESDGAVFLRVWQDRKKVLDGVMYMMVTHHGAFKDDPDNLGYRERNDQVEQIRTGRPCFLIMCLAKDVTKSPREIKSFNSDWVFVGSEVVDIEGDSYVKVCDKVRLKSVI